MIEKVDGAILHQLIEYCYSGEIANILEMTQVADMLQFDEVKENCAEFYTKILSTSNCLGIRDLADLHHVDQLKETAEDFVLHNFLEVSKSDKFVLLNINDLAVLLADDDLNVPAEEDVFVTVMGWTKHDLESRKQFLEELFYVFPH